MKLSLVIILVFLWITIIFARNVDEEHHKSRNHISKSHNKEKGNKLDESDIRHRSSHLKHSKTRHFEHGKENHKTRNSNNGINGKRSGYFKNDYSGDDNEIYEKAKDAVGPQYREVPGILRPPLIGVASNYFEGLVNNLTQPFSCIGAAMANITTAFIEQLKLGLAKERKITVMINDQVIYEAYLNNWMLSCQNSSNNVTGLVQQGLHTIIGNNSNIPNITRNYFGNV